MNKYDWKRINYHSKIDDWKVFKENNSTIALNILYVKQEEEEVYPAYISKHDSTRETKSQFLNDST